jgi:hypothetical protein
MAYAVKPEYLINPMLALVLNATVWKNVFSGTSHHGSSEGPWFEPATFPRMSSIQIISTAFPGTIEVKSASATAVTCRDIVVQLHKFISVNLDTIEMDGRRTSWLCNGAIFKFERLEEVEHIARCQAEVMPVTFVLKCDPGVPTTEPGAHRLHSRLYAC